MDQEKHRLHLSDLLNSLPESHHISSGEQEETISSCGQLDSILNSIIADDKIQFIRHLELLRLKTQCGSSSSERKTVLNLLQFCCMFDSVECAAALLNGEVGVVPLVNEMNVRGRTALHTAAEVHARHCIELLLKKHARTDLRTRDGRRLLALDLSLCSSRMDVVWNPDEHSVEDLVVCLGQKDLNVVRILSEKTKETADVAYAQGIEGQVVSFAALLMVAEEKVKESVMVLHDAESGCKEKTTIYESLIREALALGREDSTSIRVAKRTNNPTKAECNEKRKLLLCEIELLQLFGSLFPCGCIDRKVTPPLILATQAGDERLIQLLLKTNLDINEADAEGNSALHWCIKTSKSSSQQQIKVLHLLLKYGAQISQKNKLGSTAVHLAAANGNLEALQVLVQEDPDSVNSKTEMAETPLFLAVKNDRMECVDLLLHHGANTEVLNLRRQRPIDMAKSQDMRFMLNSSNIILMNHALSAQQRCVTSSQEDERLPELILPDEGTTVERSSTSIMIENHKCFDFHGGCVRETKIHFAHDEEEFQQIQKGASTTPSALKREIFVGGLPPTVDSDSLGRIFEEQFGPVEDAKVIEYEKDHQVRSQGFGLIVFKHEESVSAALQVSRVTISGKQVEIKRIVRYTKSPLPFNFDGTTPNDEQKWSHKTCHHASASDEMKADGPKSEQVSWVDRLLRGQPKVYSNDSQPPASTCFKDKSIPAWLRIFKKWLPVFLQDLSRKGSEEYYALSSLKGDFRAKFGMELDHASLGFLKLSEFMRSFPELCRLQVVPLGSSGNSNHMVIVPNFPAPHQLHSRPLTMTKSSTSANSVDTSGPAFSSETESPVSCTTEETNMKDITAGNSSENHKSHGVNPKSLTFKPYKLFGPQNSRDMDDKRVELEGSTLLHLEKHLVLEALSRRNGLHSFFLRDIDFYKDYVGSILRGSCFACKQHKMIWSNFPCQHPLWCSNCKLEALKVAAGGSDHKCVICDREVQRIDQIPWTESSQTSYRDLFVSLTSTF